MRRLISKAVSLSLIFVLLAADICPARSYAVIRGRRKAEQNQWYGRKVAFLGDSITDKRHVGTTKNYWQYLEEMLGIEPLVYGINGAQWTGVLQQARRLLSEHGQDVDAIMIFAGTNDYNASVPVGEWFFEDECGVEVSGGNIDVRRRRTPVVDESTFCGRINSVMSYLKSNFPRAQIILLPLCTVHMPSSELITFSRTNRIRTLWDISWTSMSRLSERPPTFGRCPS